jgi:DNA-binding response OmpR family regulator
MLHVVHLEDDKPLREIFSTALHTFLQDLNLKQFADSDEALRYIKWEIRDIDLYILDIRVPGSLNGVQLAEQVRKLGAKAPIMITSAYDRPEKHILDMLECRWSKKPWHMTELLHDLIPLAKEYRQARSG